MNYSADGITFKQNTFKINPGRPAFMAGEVLKTGKIENINIKKNNRTVDSSIRRNSFLAPEIKGRMVYFNGSSDNTYELGSETLSKLLDVDVPDLADVEWVEAETEAKKRLRPVIALSNPGKTVQQITELVEKELKVNPPLGRKQRTNKEKRNLGQINSNISEKFFKINNNLQVLRTITSNNKAEIIGEIALLYEEAKDNSEVMEELNNQRNTLTTMLMKMGAVNLPYKMLFPTTQRRIVSGNWLNRNFGLFSVYVLSHVPLNTILTFDKPVFNITREIKQTGKFRITSTTLLYTSQSTNKKEQFKYFIDLENRCIMSFPQVMYLGFTLENAGVIGDIKEILDDSINDDYSNEIFSGNIENADFSAKLRRMYLTREPLPDLSLMGVKN